ncbi:tetratricopeptide repeat protein [Colwellia sp. D2M02]|uniref:tetratricopeptide repeat protein n=1 Tax=Colwellia sp. D2M02 TaxID=2841562 RepID=UPI001C095C4F|nr:tetratricopeptide repeat protein [Colwellia sp. D2M02]MBU2895044.1 tetratricopeptide repeat protein [Colwellia sp. D2M02]
MKTHFFPSIIISAFVLCTSLSYSNSSLALVQHSSTDNKPLAINNIHIEQLAPVWTIQTGNNPLLERDAKLLPAEQSLALTLRPLLDQKKYQAALNAIETSSHEDYEPEPILSLSPALLQVKGQIYLSLKEYELAKSTFIEAVTLLPDFIRAHKNLAVIYIKQQNYQAARKHLIKTIELGEGDAQLFGYLAYINLQLNTPWSAIAGYQQALLLEPDNSQWQQGLLYSLIKAKDNHAAKAMLNEMLQKSPNDMRLWLQRSRISLDDNTPLDALMSMEMALRLGNTDADNLIAAAQLHLNHGSVSRAAELMSQLLRQWQQKGSYKATENSEHFDAIESVIAWLIYEKHWSEAKPLLKHTEQYANKITGTQQSQLKLHRASMPGNSATQTTRLYEQAIKLDPSNGQALIALAEHYQQQNDYTQAQLLFVRAASIEGFAERAYIGHAQVYIEQKNYDQAAVLLRKALKLNPTRQDLVQNIRLLDRMNTNQI